MVLKDHDKGVCKIFLNGYDTNRAEKPDLPRSGLVQEYLSWYLFNKYLNRVLEQEYLFLEIGSDY